MDEQDRPFGIKPGNPEGFPSARLLVMLYFLGAMLCLATSFYPGLDSNSQVSCVLLSLLMVAIGTGIGLFHAAEEEPNNDRPRQSPRGSSRFDD